MDKYQPAVVIPVVQFSYPPQRCFVIDDTGYARFKYPEYVTTRSQDLEKQYHDVGQFYIYNVEKLIKLKGIIEDDFMPIVINEMQAQDIDTEEDWKIAEIKYKYINGMLGV
jgi:N-acylneuraminate cytidylyltransferase